VDGIQRQDADRNFQFQKFPTAAVNCQHVGTTTAIACHRSPSLSDQDYRTSESNRKSSRRSISANLAYVNITIKKIHSVCPTGEVKSERPGKSNLLLCSLQEKARARGCNPHCSKALGNASVACHRGHHHPRPGRVRRPERLAAGSQNQDAQTLGDARLEELLDSMSRQKFVLRFPISNPDLIITIVETKDIAHLRETVRAALNGPLPTMLCAKQNGAFRKPVRLQYRTDG